MTDVTVTADQLEGAIENALKVGDIKAVGELLHSLALLDPFRAEKVYDALRLAVDIAKGVSRQPADGESDG